MEHNLTSSQIKRLQKKLDALYEEREYEEREEEPMDLMDAVWDYVDKHGIPATKEHDWLVHDECWDYIEENGLTYEDIRTIVED